MGRQIHFYMLEDDQEAFIDFVRARDPVDIVERDGASPEVWPIFNFRKLPRKTLILWNQRLLTRLERKFIPESNSGPYYRVDEFRLPVLEFSPCVRLKWAGRPALTQERLYGMFEDKPREFEQWYNALVRWIRTNLRRAPASFGGYIGPAACKWFKKGGYLLPQFSPPETPIWRREILKQHRGCKERE